jgi:hypothetical protein
LCVHRYTNREDTYAPYIELKDLLVNIVYVHLLEPLHILALVLMISHMHLVEDEGGYIGAMW